MKIDSLTRTQKIKQQSQQHSTDQHNQPTGHVQMCTLNIFDCQVVNYRPLSPPLHQPLPGVAANHRNHMTRRQRAVVVAAQRH